MNVYRTRLLERVIAPATEPLTLAEAKSFLRVEHTVDDALVRQLIVVARQMAERYLRQSLITQSWKLGVNDYLEEATLLPNGPVNAITQISLIDTLGNQATLASGVYRLDASRRMVLVDIYVAADRIEIVYQTGYGSAANVPSPIKQGLLMHVAQLYDHRDISAEPSGNIAAMYDLYRERML